MSLLDRYLIQIWEQSGGCAPRLVPFSEVRDLVYEEDDSDLSDLIRYVGDYSAAKGTDIATDLATMWDDVYPKSGPDGSSLVERMDAVDQQLFETQGMADKLAAIEFRKDEIVEILENKNIVNPQINETPVRAYFDIALAAPAAKAVRISAITPGAAANSYAYLIGTTTTPEGVAITYRDPQLCIDLMEDGEGSITTTAYELARLAAITADFISKFIISFDDGTPITQYGDGAAVIAATDTGSFANGAGADHVLTSTGTQIDNVVTNAPASGAPVTAQVAAAATSSDGNNDEITWTAVANGEDGNGITIDITLSAEATDIDITVDGRAIAVDVEIGKGITATDVLTAVNDHETAGLLVHGVLTGLGGAITADSVVTDEGVDITAGLAGAIRYEATKIWISVAQSTTSVSNWKYASLTDPNA